MYLLKLNSFPECMAAGVGGSVKLSTAAALPKTLFDPRTTSASTRDYATHLSPGTLDIGPWALHKTDRRNCS